MTDFFNTGGLHTTELRVPAVRALRAGVVHGRGGLVFNQNRGRHREGRHVAATRGSDTRVAQKREARSRTLRCDFITNTAVCRPPPRTHHLAH